MENTIDLEKYKIQKPESWASNIDDKQLVDYIKESDFSSKQVEEGRDFCYFLDKIYYTSDTENSEYACVAYTLNEPSNLESASVMDMVVEENETYIIHRISVLREGVLIDKILDTKIKVLDSENQSEGGILSSNRSIHSTTSFLLMGLGSIFKKSTKA